MGEAGVSKFGSVTAKLSLNTEGNVVDKIV